MNRIQMTFLSATISIVISSAVVTALWWFLTPNVPLAMLNGPLGLLLVLAIIASAILGSMVGVAAYERWILPR